MLRDMIADAGPAALAIGSMYLFILVFVGVALRVWSMTPTEGAALARLPLDDEDNGGTHGQV